ncbi:MAG: hypothetical protein KME23_14015 [Goleter apudmare HA4340-LM2]|nr:hypothetical protein [Goleter apudmare HA4340-LM2]
MSQYKSPLILTTFMQVKDLTVEELKLLIQETVTETLQSLLIDPDQGKELKKEVQQQLLESLGDMVSLH